MVSDKRLSRPNEYLKATYLVRSRPLQDVALERYGNMEDYQEALDERKALDEKESRRSARRGANPDGSNSRSDSNASGYGTPNNTSRRFVFTTDEGASSRPSSRAGFRRPGEDGRFDNAANSQRTGSPSATAGASMSTPAARSKGTGKFDTPQSSTPIPSVLTPHHLLKRNPMSSTSVPAGSLDNGITVSDSTVSIPPLTAAELNVLQAKVLKARLMDDPEADDLEAQYEHEAKRSREHSGGGDAGTGFWKGNPSGVEGQLGRETEGQSSNRTEIQVLPTLDIHGRLYDIGTSSGADEHKLLPGNRKPNLNKKVRQLTIFVVSTQKAECWGISR
ncbi:hypothetical protein QFC24_004452 [Naganishia onofrii]|uniref:Uncharacterized protein n=1 Tax=Naganishia onofrii TaxID=1851511 RepID=A0ACC2XHM2_9TREE|nr:hypothetical protein QFC24_004452 [Naganishia onofrii]